MNQNERPIPSLFLPLFATTVEESAIARALRVEEEFELLADAASDRWDPAPVLVFERNWQGENADAGRRTAVRLRWTDQTLYLRFDCRYRDLHVFGDGAMEDGRRHQLWLRDVAEAFIQTDPSRPRNYREFEISPNGLWLELDIFPGGNNPDWASGWRHAVRPHPEFSVWTAEMAIPMAALSDGGDLPPEWRINFFRVEGEPQVFHSWRPTHTPAPNFHVPDAFGRLLLVRE